MILSKQFLHRARVTIELTSPMMIASGDAQLSQDNDLMRDENGWPMIPGTSITGVLRSLVERTNLSIKHEFGAAGEDNYLSNISLSNGLVHDSKNCVQEAQKLPQHDQVLDLLASETPVLRNGVAINVRGVAEDKGKYDRTLCPTGTRFSFEISFWTDSQRHNDWLNLLSLFTHPLFSLGGGSRSGYGQFSLIDINHCELDLKLPDHAKIFRDLPKALSSTAIAMTRVSADMLIDRARQLLPITQVSLRLAPENGWRVGGGSTSFCEHAKSADLLPYSENVVEWEDNVATINNHKAVLPGTSIKGAISHRLEFHFRRLMMLWAEAPLGRYRDTDVKYLLGWVDDTNAHQGHLWFNDCYVDVDKVKVSHRTRNKIDRLTGGTIDKALFSEEQLNTGVMHVDMFVDEEKLNSIDDKLRSKIKQALELTLRDLKQGRLALGAGQNNGNGFFYEVSAQ